MMMTVITYLQQKRKYPNTKNISWRNQVWTRMSKNIFQSEIKLTAGQSTFTPIMSTRRQSSFAWMTNRIWSQLKLMKFLIIWNFLVAWSKKGHLKLRAPSWFLPEMACNSKMLSSLDVDRRSQKHMFSLSTTRSLSASIFKHKKIISLYSTQNFVMDFIPNLFLMKIL